MNKGNTYIFIYSVVMVIIVAAVLSTAAMLLKPYQDKNIMIEKKLNILSSVMDEKPEKKDVEMLYKERVTESFAINNKGEILEGIDAFDVDLKKEMRKSPEERALPVFIYSYQGNTNLIVPVIGKGLWGPIWGYVSFENDFNTIHGVSFDHKSETPGLGAEINTQWFMSPFKGKKIFDESGKFVSITVVKGGADPNSLHQVDGISGGTITSKALEKMLIDCIVSYESYFKSQNK
ncbi:MAG: NADH:ubiquinone reductase (Na(+)-transporting) subunit C [Bacteroidales bacterium]|nr:NADH:ubiquinone reductase (Na(+)-transporting) subunit C [Bacteroidales bacterium]